MRVAQIQDNYEIALAQMPVPELPARGALVKVIGCGLCGSDLDKLVNQKATPGSVLGHEVVGIIEALDDQHPSGWHLGDRIAVAHHVPCQNCHYCMNGSESMCRHFKSTNFVPGGFSQYIALSEGHQAHTAFKIPPEISHAEASCVEPLGCVLRAIRRGGQSLNGSVAIIGLGFIGLMAAQVYQGQGYNVYGVDLDRKRLQLATDEKMLTTSFHPEDREDIELVLTQQTALGKVDTVFLSVVNAHTLKLAKELVRDGGTLILFTSAPTAVTVDPTELYFRELNVITSYSPSLVDLRDAADMIFEERIRLKPLVTHRLPLSDIRTAFELYQTGEAMKVFIDTDFPDDEPSQDAPKEG